MHQHILLRNIEILPLPAGSCPFWELGNEGEGGRECTHTRHDGEALFLDVLITDCALIFKAAEESRESEAAENLVNELLAHLNPLTGQKSTFIFTNCSKTAPSTQPTSSHPTKQINQST